MNTKCDESWADLLSKFHESDKKVLKIKEKTK